MSRATLSAGRVSRRAFVRGASVLGLPVLSAASARLPALPPSGRPDRVDLAHSTNPLDVRSFGVMADGTTDDSAAMQRAVDAAQAQQRSAIMPAGTILLGVPLMLQNRDISLIGAGMAATTIRAGRRMAALIDAREDADRILSPLLLANFRLDGAGLVERNLAIRYRHHTILDRLDLVGGAVGVWEQDSWLGRRFGCRVADNAVGWWLNGSNHSSLWEGCTFTAASETHLRIRSDGTAHDGNYALLFRGCDIEFGKGHGVDVAPGATASFDTCYIGESIEGDVIRNRGRVAVRDGVVFFGAGLGVGLRPLAGEVTVIGTTVNSHGPGADRLVNLTVAEAHGLGGHGTARFDQIVGNLPLGGLPAIHGSPLAAMPLRNFVARLGRDWRAWSHGAEVVEGVGQGTARHIRCTRASAPGATMGISGPLAVERWRALRPPMIVCVYESSIPALLRLSPAPGMEPSAAIATLPATEGKRTALIMDSPLPIEDRFRVLELVAPASPDASLAVWECTIADDGAARTGSGALALLGMSQ